MFKLGGYLKNVMILLSSAVFAQVLSIILLPILTRLYSPSEFGLFTAFLSYCSMFGMFLFFSSEMSIVQTKNKIQLERAFALILGIFFTSSILLSVSIIVELSLFYFIGFDRLFEIKSFVIVGILFSGLNVIVNQFVTLQGLFAIYAKTQVVFVVLRFLLSVLLYYLGFGLEGLILGYLVPTFLVTVYIAIAAQLTKVRVNFNKSEILYTAKKYKDLLIYNTPSNFINILIVNFPIFFILKQFGPEAAGYFGLAFRIVMLPISLSNKAIGQVFFKALVGNKKRNVNNFNFIVKNIVLLSCSFPFFIIFYFWGGDIFSMIFGAEWAESGRYVSTIIPYVFLSFVVSPLSYYFVVYKKSKFLSTISLLFLLILLMSTYGTNFSNEYSFLNILTIINSMYYLTVLLFILVHSLKKKLY